LVAAIGTDLDAFQESIADLFTCFGYETTCWRLSEIIREDSDLQKSKTLRDSPESARVESFMDGGNELRERTQFPEWLALRAITKATSRRPDQGIPRANNAYVFRSLKRPEEVDLFRQTYEGGFHLIGVYAGEDCRLRNLVQRGMTEAQAKDLIRRDQEETSPFGQRTRKTFHLADAFVRFESREDTRDLARVIRLIFGHQYTTPTPDEHAMFIAFGSSLRSADLSRQVGAVVSDANGDIIAVGANDVPCFGGGLYWPGNDKRDHALGYDSNDHRRGQIVDQIAGDLNLSAEQRRLLCSGPISDITEYGRTVHAEMEALLSCARTGRTPRDGTLYTTVYPCHNCARHIVAAGIRRVVYVEPYPKSRALELHFDAITHSGESGKVSFEPFVGVGPRRFFDFFSMTLSSGYSFKDLSHARERDGRTRPPNKELRVKMRPTSYLDREKVLVSRVGVRIAELKKEGT